MIYNFVKLCMVIVVIFLNVCLMFFSRKYERKRFLLKCAHTGEFFFFFFFIQTINFAPCLTLSGLCWCKVDLSCTQWTSWCSAGSDLSTGRQLENNRHWVGISLPLLSHFPLLQINQLHMVAFYIFSPPLFHLQFSTTPPPLIFS